MMLRCILFGRRRESLSPAWTLSDFSSRRGCELSKQFSSYSRTVVNLALLKSLLLAAWLWGFYQVLSSLRLVRRLGLLSSTLGITVVVGFPFIASPESPCVSMLRWEAGNGRTSTAPSRQ